MRESEHAHMRAGQDADGKYGLGTVLLWDGVNQGSQRPYGKLKA